METIVWILLAVGLGYATVWLVKHRGKRDTELKAKADKKATRARDDASAIQRTLDGRR